MVALPCGSISIINTRRLVAAKEAAKFTEEVVLPTPPFWLVTAKTLATVISLFINAQHIYAKGISARYLAVATVLGIARHLGQAQLKV